MLHAVTEALDAGRDWTATLPALGGLAGLTYAVARAYRWQTSRMERISDAGWSRAADAEHERDEWRAIAERQRLRAVRAEAALTAAGLPIPDDGNGHPPKPLDP